MALPPKKKQTAGTVDNQNTGGPAKANAVTTTQVHGAIAAFVKNKKKMSAKTKKRVGGKLKAMVANGK